MKEETKLFLLIEKIPHEEYASKGRQLKLMMLAAQLKNLNGQFHLLDTNDFSSFNSIGQVLKAWNITSKQNTISSPNQREMIEKCYLEFPILQWSNLDQILEKSPNHFDEKIKIPLLILKCIYYPRTLCYLPDADLSFDWLSKHMEFIHQISQSLKTHFFLYSHEGLRWHQYISKPLKEIHHQEDISQNAPFLIKQLQMKSINKDNHLIQNDQKNSTSELKVVTQENQDRKSLLKIKKVA